MTRRVSSHDACARAKHTRALQNGVAQLILYALICFIYSFSEWSNNKKVTYEYDAIRL